MKLRNKNSGFTLIEMLIAISIFALVLIIATNIYLVINNSQRKIVTLQKVQEDVRFLFEAMAQEIRLGKINYEFYSDNLNNVNLHPLNGGITNNLLALISKDGNEIFYRLSATGNKVQYCEISERNDCDLTDNLLWIDITPEQVSVNDLRFIITPSANPFLASATVPVSCGTCDNGYACVSSECRYYADGNNFQPKVTMILRSVGVGSTIAEDSKINMQSTISTRIFPGEVINLDYEI